MKSVGGLIKQGLEERVRESLVFIFLYYLKHILINRKFAKFFIRTSREKRVRESFILVLGCGGDTSGEFFL